MAACIFYFVMLFSNCIEQVVPGGNYLDEALFFLLLAGVLVKLCVIGDSMTGWNRHDAWLMMALVLLLMIGTVGTLLNGSGASAVAVGKDVLMVSKFFVCFLCGKLLFLTTDRDQMLEQMRRMTRVIVVVIFLFGILSQFVDLGMGSEIRFGLRSYQFLYSHYTFLVYGEVMMAAVLCTDSRSGNRRYLVMALATMLMTLRMKAVVFCIAAVLLLLLYHRWRKIRLRYYLLAGLAGLAAAWSKIAEYLSWGFSYNMRNGLYMTGAKLAVEYFPLGVGFAGFGSNLSYEYDPQIYYDLGLSTYQGFNTGSPVLSDVFWPYIYGEFGVLGLLIFLWMLILIFRSLRCELEEEPEKLKAANMILLYLLGASMAEAVFTNSSGVFSAVLLSLYFRKRRESECQRQGIFVMKF